MSTSGRNPTPSEQGQRPPTRNEDDKIRVAKPDMYYGERDKLEKWLLQVQLYFKFNTVVQVKQPLFAISYLRGRAQEWSAPLLKRYLEDPDDDENEDIKRWMESFSRFRVEIRRNFGPSNENNVAVRVIQHLTQRKSAAEYSTQFQQYSARTDWDDKALMTMYRRGLKANVKEELMRVEAGAVIDDLETLMKTVTGIDDRLYELAMEKRHDGGLIGFRPSGNFGGGFHAKKTTHRDPYGHVPMELDFTQQKGRPKGKKQHNGGKKAILCYGCGKPGHIARNCRSKNMVQRPQLNVLRRVPLKKNGPSEDPPKAEYDDEELDAIMCDLLAAFDTPKADVRELQQRYEELEKEVVKKEKNITQIEARLKTIQDRLRELDSDDDGKDQKEKPDQGQGIEGDSDWDYLSTSEPSEEEEAPRFGLSNSVPCASASMDQQRDDSEERLESYRERVSEKLLIQEYRNDSNHPEHQVMHWSACADDYCKTHWAVWTYEGRTPMTPACRHRDWRNCQRLDCTWHLATKRGQSFFPGYDDKWHQHLHTHLRHEMDTEECHLTEWYACLHDQCQKHMRQKKITKFLPDSGKE